VLPRDVVRLDGNADFRSQPFVFGLAYPDYCRADLSRQRVEGRQHWLIFFQGPLRNGAGLFLKARFEPSRRGRFLPARRFRRVPAGSGHTPSGVSGANACPGAFRSLLVRAQAAVAMGPVDGVFSAGR
jgi:hypothetical protein